MDFVASCKKKMGSKQCAFHFCHSCLLNRYGEKAEEVAVLNNWMCPKCRGICNCSFCMRKRGEHRTRTLVHAAKTKGFSSESERHLKDSDNSGSKNSTHAAASAQKQQAPNKAKICKEVDGLQRPSNSKVQLKPSEIEGAGVETRSSKVKRLRDNNGNGIASGDKKDAQVKLSYVQGAGVETRSSKLKRLRDNNRNENVSGHNEDGQVKLSEIQGAGLKPGSRKLKRSRDGNETVSGEKKDAQVKLLNIQGAEVKTRSSKLKRLRENNGDGNISGDDEDAQVKLSEIQDTGVKTRSRKLKRLGSSNGDKNVSGDNKDAQVKFSKNGGAGVKTRSGKLKCLRDSNGNDNVSGDNKGAQVKLLDIHGAQVKTRNGKLRRLRDNNGNENASGDYKDAPVKLLEIQGAGVKTRSGKLGRLRGNNGNENVSGDSKDAPAKLWEIQCAGVKTRSSKLRRLRDNNGNENAPGDSEVAPVKLSEIQGAGIKIRSSKLRRLRDDNGNGNENASGDSKDAHSLAQNSGPKRHQMSKGLGNDFQRPSSSMVQAKCSKIVGIGTEVSGKLKRLRDNNRSENVSGENNDATSNTQKSNTKRRQDSKGASRENEKIFQRDHGGRLIGMNSDMRTPEKDFQDSINDHRKTEVLNNLDIDDTVAKNKPPVGPDGCEKKNIVEVKRKLSSKEISLPCGNILNNVASVEIPAEDVGRAFQFLEFCQAFGQILNLGKGRSEQLLRELVCGRSKRRIHSSPIAQFHIQLLSLIQKNSGKGYSYFQKLSENSWVQVLFRFVSESHFFFNELQVDCFEVGDYDQLDISKKLKLLNFLCDEALGTTDFRSWIDEQNSKFVQKKLKEKVLDEEEKKNKKLQDEIPKACLMKNGAPFSISEHADLLPKLKLEVAQTLSRTVEASEGMVNVSKEELRSDALRLEPMFLDGHGHKFWRLRCYSAKMNILLQDIEMGDQIVAKERWYAYDVEQKALVEKYVSSFRDLRK